MGSVRDEVRISPVWWQLAATWAIAVSTVWLVAAITVSNATDCGSGMPCPSSLVAAMSSWDGGHYYIIAKNGYLTEGVESRRFAFFPLFPYLARWIGALAGQTDPRVAGVVLNQILLLGTCVIMGRLSNPAAPARLWAQPGFWLLISPLAFYLHVFYTESLFLFLSLAALLAYRGNRVALAFASGFLLGLTRPTAFLLSAYFLAEGVRTIWRRDDPRTALLCAAAPVAGVATYVIMAGYLLGDPLFGYIRIQDTFWQNRWAIPLEPMFTHLQLLVTSFIEVVANAEGLGGKIRKAIYWLIWFGSSDQGVRIFSVAAISVLMLWGWRRIDWPMFAYLAVSMAFIHSRFPYHSTARYELVLFPVYLIVVRTRLADTPYAPLLAAGLVVWQIWLLIKFLTWHWVA